LYGPIIGSAVFTYLEEILLTKIPEFFMIIFGLILIISMLYMPYGIGGVIQNQIQKWRIKRLGEKHANT
jgi:branched-chain amino acid transport system permease protein